MRKKNQINLGTREEQENELKTLRPESLQPETLEEFCSRWKVKLSWGYRRTRMSGEDRLPHIKVGKYIRVIPEIGDSWMMGGNQNFK